MIYPKNQWPLTTLDSDMVDTSLLGHMASSPGTGTAMRSGESHDSLVPFTGMSSRKGARSATRRPCPEKASTLENHAILEVFQNQLQPNVPQLCPLNTENDDHPPKIWRGPTNF